MLTVNQTYSFSTLSPAVLGSSFTNMRVKALMTVSEAIKYRDVSTLHTVLKNTIPALPDIGICTFVLLENINKEKVVLAYEWLDINSITSVTTTNIRIDLLNVTSDDLAILRNRMLELGYVNFDITTF
jgi:hypothetical protein